MPVEEIHNFITFSCLRQHGVLNGKVVTEQVCVCVCLLVYLGYWCVFAPQESFVCVGMFVDATSVKMVPH
jgi:hypothetical protein